MKVEVLIEAIDRLTQPVQRMQDRLEKFTEPARKAGAAIERLGEAGGVTRLTTAFGAVAGRARETASAIADVAARLSLIGAGAAAGGVALFKTQFLDVAASFEQFKTTLAVVEGSNEQADKSFAWIKDFATQTPYNIEQVTAAFVRMKTAGLDPTNGSLEAAGNAASSIAGKTVMDAVEAVADAVVGQNERLKEFGIRATTQGNKIVYDYMANGRAMKRVADANSQQMIQSTIQGIWNDQYAGAMEKQSKTWSGMMSNLGNSWTNWTMDVMKAGVFDWLKSRLQGVLETISRLGNDGTLKRWSDRLAELMLQGLTAVEGFVTTLPQRLDAFGKRVEGITARLRPFADLVGGWPELMTVIAGAIIGGPIIAALASLATAFVTLGAAITLTPFGWVIGIAAALAAAAALIYANWGGIARFFRGLWSDVMAAFKTFFDWSDGIVTPWVERLTSGIRTVRAAIDSAAGFFGLGGGAAPSAGGAPIGAASVPIAPTQRVDTGGLLRITVDRAGMPQITEARPADPGTEWQIDRGLAMGY